MALSACIAAVLPLATVPAAQAADVKLRVAVLPIANLTPVYISKKNGYFQSEGLDVDLTVAQGGAELLPTLVAGTIQIGYSAWTPALLARAQGYDLMIIAGHANAREKPPEGGALIVPKDSPIQGYKDLKGKRVSVNNVQSVAWLTIVEPMRRVGLGPKDVTFVEMPYPVMNDALLNGRLDAIAQVEPFTTILMSSGKARIIGYPYIDTLPRLPIAGWVASEKWVSRNPETTEKFVRAFRRGVEFMNSNKEESLQLMVEFSKLDPAIARKVQLDHFDASVNVELLQKQADLMLQHKLLDKKLDVSRMVYKTAK
jgi:NitT/TauT family transport system substrate-binding protein